MGMDMKIDTLVSPVRDIYICMISLAKIVRQILSEAMSFRDLWDSTNRVDQGARQTRSHHVRVKDMAGRATADGSGWTFSYGEDRNTVTVGGDTAVVKKFKSEPSWNTTGKSWAGHVKLLKDQKAYSPENIEIQDLNCEVDCTCPDYKYRWAYNNAQMGAGSVGAGSWNKNSGESPKRYTQGPGMCKHLMALVEYLGTNIKPVAPKPDDKPPQVHKKKPIEKPAVSPQLPPPKSPPEKTSIQKPINSKPTTSTPSSATPVSTKKTDTTQQAKPPQQIVPPTANAPKPDELDDTDTYSDTRGLEETTSQQTLAQTLDMFVNQNQKFNFPMYDDKK